MTTRKLILRLLALALICNFGITTALEEDVADILLTSEDIIKLQIKILELETEEKHNLPEVRNYFSLKADAGETFYADERNITYSWAMEKGLIGLFTFRKMDLSLINISLWMAENDASDEYLRIPLTWSYDRIFYRSKKELLILPD